MGIDHADRVEAVQLGLANRLLVRARHVLDSPDVPSRELGLLASALTAALNDALLIAGSREAPAERGTAPRTLGLLVLPGGDLSCARAARRHVRSAAELWGMLPDEADTLEAITGELAANALEHSGSRAVTVSVLRTAGAVVVSVSDEGQERVSGARQSEAPEGEGEGDGERGRGLFIVEAMAARWGSRRHGGGLTVWAEVAVGPEGK
ncbi:ATP-binding protein [Streptomyces beigongshangae]|uniref:ATP-binding protein n=1 Tax=Streptomyces beigongshangae TaxID=2841597 RepID=UPI001C84241F|nr:ATP-binding protein [Streptomyces sp. REN17]